MPAMITLDAQIRNTKDSLDFLRTKGFIPAVFYGPKKTSTAISVDLSAFTKVLKEAGESTPVTLKVSDGTTLETLIHEVELDPVKGTPKHADFLIIDTNKPVHVSVPLEFDGVSEAVKTGGGTLVKVLHEIEIEALPKDLPHVIHVDISKLATLDDQITVNDILLPKGVTLKTKDHEIVASVVGQKEEVETTSAPDLASIEVEKKGKKDEEETEA